ncbi:hypothetical protein G7Z17_g8152 [Cylindrodendrum hubeiense]|uniref:Uncharacterized protein n=1 Tax=Cylindrodendrum hubeiense TaxID=595255 RepID=A0A9P5LDG1_9HYPO|nr:hypothetical protein G7Z17_g8152 [Cylindrodendrum hubeiense]
MNRSLKSKPAPGSRYASTQPVRQTRARSQLNNAPPLMKGLNDRGVPTDPLSRDPEALTYNEVLDSIRRQQEPNFRRSQSPEPETPHRHQSPASPTPRQSSAGDTDIGSPPGYEASEGSNTQHGSPSDKSDAATYGGSSRATSTPSSSSSSSESGPDPNSPSLTRRGSLNPAPISSGRRVREVRPIRALELPRPSLATTESASFDIFNDSSSAQAAPEAGGNSRDSSNGRNQPLRPSPLADSDRDELRYMDGSSDNSSSNPESEPGDSTTEAAESLPVSDRMSPDVQIKEESSPSPSPVSKTGASSSSSGCSGDQLRKRKWSDDDEGSGPLARKRRPSEEDLYFYDTRRTSSASNTQGSKNNKSTKNSEIPGIYGSALRSRLNYDWYEQYHVFGIDCARVHGCRRVCHECHAKWHRDWARYFQVEEEIASALENPNGYLHMGEDGFGVLQILDSIPSPPRGGKVRDHPARLSKQRLLAQKVG